MSDRTQAEGRSFYTEHDYTFTPSPRAAGNVVLENREWVNGLLAATRVGDPTFDFVAKAIINNGAEVPEPVTVTLTLDPATVVGQLPGVTFTATGAVAAVADDAVLSGALIVPGIPAIALSAADFVVSGATATLTKTFQSSALVDGSAGSYKVVLQVVQAVDGIPSNPANGEATLATA